MFLKLSTLGRVLVVTETLCCRHRLWAMFELFVARAGAQAREHRLTKRAVKRQDFIAKYQMDCERTLCTIVGMKHNASPSDS